MSTLSDILGLLELWPRWKMISHAPERIDALEKRIAKLEQALAQPRKGGATAQCPICGEGMKVIKVAPHAIFGDMGMQSRHFQCNCGHAEIRDHDPSKESGR